MKTKLTLNERIAEEQQDEELVELRDMCLRLVKHSKSKMSEFYARWDRNWEIYKGKKIADEEDLEARDANEPEKVIVPMNFADAQTFIAFCFLLFQRSKNFFEMDPTGEEDYLLRLDCEKILGRDLRKNKWPTKLYQFLQDIAVMGVGVLKEWWTVDKARFVDPMAVELGLEEVAPTEELVTYEGNKIANVSPYLFFPDCRVPLSDWEEGQFAADESEVTKESMLKEAADGNYFGVEHVEKLTLDRLKSHGGTRLEGVNDFVGKQPKRTLKRKGEDKKDDVNEVMCKLEIHIDLIPEDYNLGIEDYPVRFSIVILNNDRIVKISRLHYLHRKFPYNVAQFSPTMHEQVGMALSDVTFNLQEIMTWLFNSRLLSVRRALDGKTVLDLDFVDPDSFADPLSPYIFLKKGAPKIGVDKFFAQLQFRDSTANNFAEISQIRGISQECTGVNDNAMGQMSSGRRSATEARAANSGASARLKTPAVMIYNDGIAPMGQKMLSNSRQGISLPTFVKIVGKAPITVGMAPMQQQITVEQRYEQFRPLDWRELVGSEDFFVLDNTVESERAFIAQSLQELIGMIMTNPNNAVIFDLDPKAMINEILELRGVGRAGRFSLHFNNPNASGLLQKQGQPGVSGDSTGDTGFPTESPV